MGERLLVGYLVVAIWVLGYLRGCDATTALPQTWKDHAATLITAATWPGALIIGWWLSRPAATPKGGA